MLDIRNAFPVFEVPRDKAAWRYRPRADGSASAGPFRSQTLGRRLGVDAEQPASAT
ncbi:hypothetical protein SALBM217S_09998 [Streptomyces griseoloalbus]